MTREDLRHDAEQRAATGDLLGAAEIYEKAGCHFEAAHARQTAGDPALALTSLTRIPADHPDYRKACVLAVHLAHQQDRLSLTLENLLARFLRSAPENDAEVDALDRLAQLYQRHGFPENAVEILHKLSVHGPGYAEAAQRLSAGLAPSAPELADLPQLPAPPAAEKPEDLPEVRSAQAEEEIPALQAGTVIAGRYQLGEQVGIGGSSVVYRATDLELGEAIAVKVLTRAVFNAEIDARLRRELMLSRQLVHRNIVRVYETGLCQGFRYLTMELLEGLKLSDRLRRGALGLDEGLSYLAQACAGLQAAHDLGVIHRDVKPGNFFVARGGVLKVMDFGLAKVRNAPGLTATGVIGGTPAYMAPEQASDFRSVTAATDIYALGVVAYEMFTGMLPFTHENSISVLIMHRDTPPPPPRSRSPALPAELERIILRCLEKDPSRRFWSCQELGQTIVALRSR